MAQNREIIGLNVGGFAQWVKTHDLNLLSEGARRGGQPKTTELYTERGSEKMLPRLVCYDLRGRRGSLFIEESPAIDSQQAAISAWNGNVQCIASEEHPRNPFLRAGIQDKGAWAEDDGNEKGEDEEGEEHEDDVWGLEEIVIVNTASGSSEFERQAQAMLQRQASSEAGSKEAGQVLEEEGENTPENPGDGVDAAEIDEVEEAGALRTPEVWSDFLEERLDPQSYLEVPLWDVQQGAFSTYAAGDFNDQGCALPVAFRDDAWDRVRLYLEECESIQGFEMMADAEGGFAGLASALASECREECRSATISCSLLLNPPRLPTDTAPEDLFDAGGLKSAARRSLDESLAMMGLLEHASIVMPLRGKDNHHDMNEKAPNEEPVDGLDLWRTSADLATVVHAVSLPYRFEPPLSGRKLLMRDWASVLSPRRDLRVLAVQFWQPSQEPVPVPPATPSEVHWSRMLIGRGSSEWPQQPCDERALKLAYPQMPLPRTFPRDLIREESRDDGKEWVGALGVGVGCSDGLYPWLASLTAPLEGQSGAQRAALTAAGLNNEDRAAMCEDLRSLADAYTP